MNDKYLFFLVMFVPIMGIIFSILSIIKNYLSNIVNLKIVKNYQEYETLAEFYFKKAYLVIYKDDIMVYATEGLKPKEEDIKDIQHKYLNLLSELLGDWLLEQLTTYYGDGHTLYMNALTFFDENYENDAIQQAAIDKQLSETIDKH